MYIILVFTTATLITLSSLAKLPFARLLVLDVSYITANLYCMFHVRLSRCSTDLRFIREERTDLIIIDVSNLFIRNVIVSVTMTVHDYVVAFFELILRLVGAPPACKY